MKNSLKNLGAALTLGGALFGGHKLAMYHETGEQSDAAANVRSITDTSTRNVMELIKKHADDPVAVRELAELQLKHMDSATYIEQHGTLPPAESKD